MGMCKLHKPLIDRRRRYKILLVYSYDLIALVLILSMREVNFFGRKIELQNIFSVALIQKEKLMLKTKKVLI